MDSVLSDKFDLLVIGGGIVGAGVAREAAMRGQRTALIEKNDFAAGTSSRSTRLLHGGIRYLAQGRIGLVREANKEKVVIHRIAPHLSHPLPFIFPSRTGAGYPRWQLSIGVKIYDLLCGSRNLGRSRTLSKRQTLEAIPGYSPDRLTGAIRYFDGLTNDARLVLDTLRSAERNGAEIRNRTEFRGATRTANTWESTLYDRHTDSTFSLLSHSIVNATGPWSDQVPGSQTTLRITKGVHLVVDRSRLPIRDAIVTVEEERILFAIPWGERVILGTTDTDYAGPLDEPRCELEDAQYILDAVNKDFPAAKLGIEDVSSTWAGLRPLVANPNDSPSDISRRHEITMSNPGWWDITGGKLTTYRLMGEETVDAIGRFLKRSLAPSQSAHVPLLSYEDIKNVSGILPPEVSQETIQHYCQNEWAHHLEDVMIRRTSWRYYHTDHLQIAEQVAEWMQPELGWTDEQRQTELQRYRERTAAEALR